MENEIMFLILLTLLIIKDFFLFIINFIFVNLFKILFFMLN